MSFSSLRTLNAVLGVLLAAGFVASGCSGADFSAGGVAGAAALAGESSGGAAIGGSMNAHAGRGGQDSAGANGGRIDAGGTSAGGALGGSGGNAEAGAPVELGGSGGHGASGGAGGATAGAGGLLGMSGAAAEAGAGVGGACDPVPWFPDDDGDGFGRSSGQIVACDPPTNGVWVLKGGDCNDDNKAVFPNRAAYVAAGYTTSGNDVSFDYDCSGMEEVDPTSKGAAPDCTVLSCKGSGFQPTARTGPGVNSLFGSKALVTCTAGTLTCTGVVTQVTEGVRCH